MARSSSVSDLGLAMVRKRFGESGTSGGSSPAGHRRQDGHAITLAQPVRAVHGFLADKDEDRLLQALIIGEQKAPERLVARVAELTEQLGQRTAVGDLDRFGRAAGR